METMETPLNPPLGYCRVPQYSTKPFVMTAFSIALLLSILCVIICYMLEN